MRSRDLASSKRFSRTRETTKLLAAPTACFAKPSGNGSRTAPPPRRSTAPSRRGTHRGSQACQHCFAQRRGAITRPHRPSTRTSVRGIPPASRARATCSYAPGHSTDRSAAGGSTIVGGVINLSSDKAGKSMALVAVCQTRAAPRRAAAAFTTLSSNHRYAIVTRAREERSAGPRHLRRRPRRALDHGMKSGSEERFRYLCTECRLSQTVSKWNTGLST